MIIAATGHRPNKLGGYSEDAAMGLMNIAVVYLANQRPAQVISGMALGWDTAVARAALTLSIPLLAAIPFPSQHRFWSADAQQRYCEILEVAHEVRMISQGKYSAEKMQRRNEWMVAHCDRLMAMWDGSKGGTANCLAAAQAAGKPWDNLWPSWEVRRAVAEMDQFTSAGIEGAEFS